MYFACILYTGNPYLKEYIDYLLSFCQEVFVGYTDTPFEGGIKLNNLSFDELFDKVKSHIKKAGIVLFAKDTDIIPEEAFYRASTFDILPIRCQCVKDYLNAFCKDLYYTGPFLCRAFVSESKDNLYNHFKTLNPQNALGLGYKFCECEEVVCVSEDSINIKINPIKDCIDDNKSLKIAFIDAAPGYGGGQVMAYRFFELLRYEYDIYFFILSDKLYKKLKSYTKNVFYMKDVNYFDFNSWKPYFESQIKAKNFDIYIVNSNIGINHQDKPIIYYTHETMERLEKGLYPTDIPYLNAFIETLKKDPKMFVVAASGLAPKFLSSKGVPKDKLLEVPNWMDIPQNITPKSYPKTSFRVGWLSRFIPEKGWRDLVEALKDTDIEVDFIGEGDDLEVAKSLKKEQNLKNMNFLGWVEDAYTHLKDNVDLFVFTSHDILQESFGLVQVEAMSLGLPVISHDIPASRYVLGKEGLFYKTPEELRELILRLKSDEEFYNKSALYSVKRVKNFSKEKAYKRWKKVIEEVMERIKGE